MSYRSKAPAPSREAPKIAQGGLWRFLRWEGSLNSQRCSVRRTSAPWRRWKNRTNPFTTQLDVIFGLHSVALPESDSFLNPKGIQEAV